MPRVRYVAFIEEINGTMCDVVLKRSPRGNTIVTKRPDMSNVEWSPAQKDQRSRFSLANEYAKAAMAHPQVRAVYEARAAEEDRQPYRLAFSDYFKGNDLLTGHLQTAE